MKLAVHYDRNLKEEVFVVRDDESYVSTTKTILTVSDPVLEEEFDYREYGVDVTINVLRDIGDSTIVLYDGDDVLEAFDWTGTIISTHYDFPVGTAHKLRAVFMGNRRCLKSQSKSIDVFLPYTSNETRLTYTGSSIISTGTSFSFGLTNEHGVEIHGGTLTVSYMSGSVNDVQTVDVDTGVATVDFSGTLPNVARGLINLTAVYNGTENYAPAMLEFQVSKYYNVTLEGYVTLSNGLTKDSRHILGESYTLKGTMVDFMGNPITSTMLGSTVKIYASREFNWELLDSGNIGDGGTFQTVVSDERFEVYYDRFKFGTGDETTFDVFNPSIKPFVVYVDRITVNKVRVSGSDSTETFNIDISGFDYERGSVSLTGVPVHVTNTAFGIDDVYFTNTQGRVTCSYAPQLGQNGFALTIKSGEISTIHSIPYYLTYYDAPLWGGQDLGLEKVTTQTLQTGTQYNATPGGAYSTIYADIPDDLFNYKQKWSYKVVSTTDNTFYYGLYGMNGEITVYGVPNDNWLSAGDTAEYVYDPANNSIVCTVNNRERFRDTISNSKRYPAIIRINSNGSVVLNNIKHEVLPSL